ncbi:MAG TPA: biotin/lipoyl-containing protein [Abditibacteriaceae bacterium]|jgi:pyruvate dehydrogenase E2 component (dihydrolipoamide acetyltransferase)
MITRIVIPQAFENMEEATIGAWLKSEGDSVTPGEALCELITEKTTFPLEAEGSGVLRHIAANEKSIVPVGTVIGLIGEANDELPDIEIENARLRERLAASKEEPTQVAVPTLAPTPTSTQAAPAGGSRVRATPAARRAARDRGVDIEEVAKAFPGKVLSEDDVKSFEL